MAERLDPVALSVVAAAHNEQENVGPLVAEIDAVLGSAGLDYETIVVDDGSTDRTLAALTALLRDHPRLRVVRLRHTPPGRGNGQSAAFHAGIRAARGTLIALIDADCQNDPADVPSMIRLLEETAADMVQGDRSGSRRDGLVRRVTSRVGRLARRWLLGDTIRDTGCSLRVMRRDVALKLPLQWRGMHRFIPFTARQLGCRVVEMPVRHRPRTAGRAKYGIGNRAIPGLIDCLAVRWMGRRRRDASFDEIDSPPGPPTSATGTTT
jgi:glycosyltransferase involved in cell wall biosynthesis